MAITWQNVVNVAPELASVAVGTQAEILADTLLQMNADVWGPKFDMGRKYLAAHLATLDRRKGAGGALQAQTVGQVSRSFAATQNTSPFASTSYGLIYEGLLLTLSAARVDIG